MRRHLRFASFQMCEYFFGVFVLRWPLRRRFADLISRQVFVFLVGQGHEGFLAKRIALRIREVRQVDIVRAFELVHQVLHCLAVDGLDVGAQAGVDRDEVFGTEVRVGEEGARNEVDLHGRKLAATEVFCLVALHGLVTVLEVEAAHLPARRAAFLGRLDHDLRFAALSVIHVGLPRSQPDPYLVLPLSLRLQMALAGKLNIGGPVVSELARRAHKLHSAESAQLFNFFSHFVVTPQPLLVPQQVQHLHELLNGFPVVEVLKVDLFARVFIEHDFQ